MKWYESHWPALASSFEQIDRDQMCVSQVDEWSPVSSGGPIHAVIGTGRCGKCNQFAADINHWTNQHELDIGTIRQLSKRIAELEGEARVADQENLRLQTEIDGLTAQGEFNEEIRLDRRAGFNTTSMGE